MRRVSLGDTPLQLDKPATGVVRLFADWPRLYALHLEYNWGVMALVLRFKEKERKWKTKLIIWRNLSIY